MKQKKTYLILMLFLVSSMTSVFAANLFIETQDVSDRHYFTKLREMIMHAKETIDVSLGDVSMSGKHYDPTEEVLNDLINASKRGVRVRLFLNTFSSASYDASLFLREDLLENFNKAKVKVFFVNPRYHLTDQLVLFDRHLILEGGPSWTEKGFTSALSSATLNSSEKVAEEKRKRLELLPIWNIRMNREARLQGELAVPLFLLREVDYFPGMIRAEDGNALKIYLKLLRLFYETQSPEITVEFKTLASQIPADKFYEESSVVFEVYSAVERLEKSYNLLTIIEEGVEDVRVELRLPESLMPVVGVPMAFLDENYAKEFSPHGIYAYMLILYRSQMSGKAPVWLGSITNLEQDFPIQLSYFEAGIAELRQSNLVEVYPFYLKQQKERVSLEKPEYRYLLNDIPSLSERLQIWDRLRSEFGDISFTKARSLAKLLGEPDDPKVITTYIELLQKFSVEDIKSLTKHVARLPVKSTPAMLDYLVLLLQNETQHAHQLAI